MSGYVCTHVELSIVRVSFSLTRLALSLRARLDIVRSQNEIDCMRSPDSKVKQRVNSGRYEIDERGHPDEEWKTTSELKIRRLEKTDLGEYTCSASSSMGKAEATLRVYGESTYAIERVIFPRSMFPRFRLPFQLYMRTFSLTSVTRCFSSQPMFAFLRSPVPVTDNTDFVGHDLSLSTVRSFTLADEVVEPVADFPRKKLIQSSVLHGIFLD